MINKKLLSFDRKALHYVGLNVLFQWLGMLCNVVLVMTVSRLIGGVFAGTLTSTALWQGMLLCLLTVPVRYGLTLCASDMSDRASKDVKPHPAQQHLCKAHPAGGRLQRDGGHQ